MAIVARVEGLKQPMKMSNYYSMALTKANRVGGALPPGGFVKNPAFAYTRR
jgi:hypothetical protein